MLRGDYSREELVAEMGAAFLCGEAGIFDRTVNNSAAYLARLVKSPRQ
jgi:antirestriction protein ArdC